MKNLLLLPLLFTTHLLFSQCFPAESCETANICLFNKAALESKTWNNTFATFDSFNLVVCGQIAIHNDQWFGFIASGDPLDITVIASNCANGDGLQIALMESCTVDAFTCNPGGAGSASDPLQLFHPGLEAGKQYFLIIDGWVSDACDYNFIVTSGIGDATSGGKITGTVRIDQNDDCLSDSTDLPAPNVPVSKTGNYAFTVPTKADGSYTFYQQDTIDVVISVLPIPGGAWEVCTDSVLVLGDTLQQVDTVNFVLKPLVQCPIATVELGPAPFLRACLTSKLVVKYGNYGTIPAENMRVAVVIPNELEILQKPENLPFTQQGDTLIFEVGNLGPLEFNNLTFLVRPPCNNGLFGRTLCFESYVKISNPCPEVAISHPKIRLQAECIGDSTVQFTLTNKGGAPTLTPFKYLVYKNDQLVATQTYTLDNGASFTLSYPAAGETWRLESDRDDTGARTTVFIEGCSGLTPGQANMYWLDDPDLDHDKKCRDVVGSYDPNGKFAFPTGVGPDHILPANAPLEYVIHFQNTGNDTAFRVLLRDVLPNTLNPLHFRPGAASHPYTWQLLNHTLDVVFDPIILPDTFTNKAASSGWFQFFIDQAADLPDGTLIQNAAAIYFDFNAPIITDTVWHNIGRLSVQVSQPKTAALIRWNVLGNPAADRCVFQRNTPTTVVTRLELYHLDGKLAHVLEIAPGTNGILERSNLPAGMYLFRMVEAGAVTGSGKVMFN